MCGDAGCGVCPTLNTWRGGQESAPCCPFALALLPPQLPHPSGLASPFQTCPLGLVSCQGLQRGWRFLLSQLTAHKSGWPGWKGRAPCSLLTAWRRAGSRSPAHTPMPPARLMDKRWCRRVPSVAAHSHRIRLASKSTDPTSRRSLWERWGCGCVRRGVCELGRDQRQPLYAQAQPHCQGMAGGSPACSLPAPPRPAHLQPGSHQRGDRPGQVPARAQPRLRQHCHRWVVFLGS